MDNHSRIVVAMSGGVDSSVAAALLVSQGYEVIGLMLRLWSEDYEKSENRCCSPDSMAMARRVAAKLNIPFYALDARDLFYESVVKEFITGYAQGVTPNPCLICNRTIRWEFLLNKAKDLGASFIATGHYARKVIESASKFQLLRAIDNTKDQSYVLHVLNQEQLSQTLFPLGEFTKSRVRKIATDFELPVAERSESQDLCFIGGGNYCDFLIRNNSAIKKPGPILDRLGNHLGVHQGLAFFTIGQRKGLGVTAPEPLYVLEKDIKQNALIIGNTKMRAKPELLAHNVNWISGEPPTRPIRAQVKVRYQAQEANGIVNSLNNKSVHVKFNEGQNDVTPGQAVVFYDGEICLGGGIISR